MFAFVTFALYLLSANEIIASVQTDIYRKNDLFSEIMCPLAGIDFGLSAKVARCATKCNIHVTCAGFFYNKQSQMCKGVPEVLTNTTGCISMPNTAYYTSGNRSKSLH
jgi:hypothetical protein